MTRTALLGAALAAAFAAAACGGSSPSTTTNPYGASAPSGSPAAAAASDVATVKVASGPLGQILVDGNGRSLYLFVADKGTASSCYGDCATAWPPLLTSGAPVAGDGVTASLVGTTQRKDGKLEVVYNGHPLYYFIADKKPGDTTGQALNNFGADWYVLGPTGNKIDNG